MSFSQAGMALNPAPMTNKLPNRNREVESSSLQDRLPGSPTNGLPPVPGRRVVILHRVQQRQVSLRFADNSGYVGNQHS